MRSYEAYGDSGSGICLHSSLSMPDASPESIRQSCWRPRPRWKPLNQRKQLYEHATTSGWWGIRITFRLDSDGKRR